MVTTPGNKVYYVNADSGAFNAQHEELKELEMQMSTLGISKLLGQKYVAESADAKRIDQMQANSVLSHHFHGTGVITPTSLLFRSPLPKYRTTKDKYQPRLRFLPHVGPRHQRCRPTYATKEPSATKLTSKFSAPAK